MNKFVDKHLVIHIVKLSLFMILSIVSVVWAWNTAMTAIFGLPVIQAKEALGIIILLIGGSMLFKSHGCATNRVNRQKS